MANMNSDIYRPGGEGTMQADRWRSLGLRGALAIIFGLIALIWPGITVRALVIVFGIYALINGLAALWGAFRDRETEERGWLIFSGLISLAAGIAALVWPRITALALIWLIGAWFLITGVFELVGAVMRRGGVGGQGLMGLSGALSVIFGLVLVIWPGAGAAALSWLIGIFAIVVGLTMLYLAFRARQMHPTPSRARAEHGMDEGHRRAA
ncbi:HdeD family acid-resistance protein [Acrocarpospora catenulata]|uniref:HdeD family acid-resistance protein n=1 Tax=Acrocarpospora catenulata TaxID=2836182 RepID=UPI002023B4B2|nr:HdeD family acid-resistance protein [Acrocarpospora catenulata]